MQGRDRGFPSANAPSPIPCPESLADALRHVASEDDAERRRDLLAQALEHLASAWGRSLEQAKLEALAQFAYGAGHEINNPLANISMRAQALLKDEQDPGRRRLLASINSQAFRAHEMIADIMLFARPPKLTIRSTDLVQIAQEVVRELSADAVRQDTRLTCRAADSTLLADVDCVQIPVALRAICVNALEALGLGGTVEIAVLQMQSESGIPEARIVVTDTGPGIPHDVRRHMFDPFFSGREAGRGLGFGLSKAWRIINAHGGWIEAMDREGGGAMVVVRLPHREAQASAA